MDGSFRNSGFMWAAEEEHMKEVERVSFLTGLGGGATGYGRGHGRGDGGSDRDMMYWRTLCTFGRGESQQDFL